jgi:hypothetical protein
MPTPERRTISFGGPVASKVPSPATRPPGHGEALPPKPVEIPEELRGRQLTLGLGTVLEKIPPHFVLSGKHDPERQLRFAIEDLFAGIARGAPTVRLTVLAGKCPEVFRSEIASRDDIEIPLPLRELVDQIDVFPLPKDQKPAPEVDSVPLVNERASKTGAPAVETVSPTPDRTALQALFHTDESLDLASAAALIADFPAVRGCVVHSAGKIERAGAIPESIRVGNLDDVGSGLFDPVGRFATRLQIGDVQSLSLGNEDLLVTLFRSGVVTLFVLHREGDFPPGIRARLTAIVLELARLA